MTKRRPRTTDDGREIGRWYSTAPVVTHRLAVPLTVGDRFVHTSQHFWNNGTRKHDAQCRLLTHKRAKKCYCPFDGEYERDIVVSMVTAVHLNGFEYINVEVVSVENPPPTNPQGCIRVGLTGGMTWSHLAHEVAVGNVEWLTRKAVQ